MHIDSLKEAFEDSFNRWNEKTAITFFRRGDRETTLTFSELDRDANRLAHYLCGMGVEKGDRVILFMEKSMMAVVAHVALQKLGAVTVPLNPGFMKGEMEYLLNDAKAVLVLTEPEKEALITEMVPGQKILTVSTNKSYQAVDFFRSSSHSSPAVDIQPDDPGLIIYTSGTTGDPKGAVLTQRNLVHDALNIIHIWKISDRDVLCHALPLFHVHGLCFALHTALMAGARTRLLDRFDTMVVLQILSDRDADTRCTMFMAVPAMYTKLMDGLDGDEKDFSHLRLLTSGSAPLPVREFERIRTIFGKTPVEREGMSETGMNFSNPLGGECKPGSIGLPLPGLEVRLVDPDSFQDVQQGQTGEIWLKGPGITPGYWQKPRETAEAFVDGWFRTGDLGKVDREGYYYLTDRIKHIIISGGENVSAKEVESVIHRMEGVAESVVVGKPDEKWGEKVVAAVKLKPNAQVTEADIRGFCKTHLHPWKCPKEILFLDEIPRNTMGKILKEQVKAIFVNMP